MKAVRNVALGGRTVMVTIHQPSINIFEAFDSLLLMQRGGRVTYFGPLGEHSSELVSYLQAVPGEGRVCQGCVMCVNGTTPPSPHLAGITPSPPPQHNTTTSVLRPHPPILLTQFPLPTAAVLIHPLYLYAPTSPFHCRHCTSTTGP